MIELQKTSYLDKLIRVEPLNGDIFTDEQGGHKFIVTCYQNGEKVNLTGVISGRFMRPGGSVALTGSAVNGQAIITLTSECYQRNGGFLLTVFNTVGSDKFVIYACSGNVRRSKSDPLIDGGSIIESVEDLIDDVNTAIAQIPVNYNASFAPAFSATKSYAVGDYVTNNGNLYRFTAAHAAGSWTGDPPTDAVQVALGNDVSGLRNTVDRLPQFIGNRVSVPGDFTPYRTFPASQYGMPPTGNIPKTTIYNIADYLQSSTINSEITYPIQIRDANGNLIYDITFDNGTASSGVQCIYYDKAGNYVSYLNAPNFDPTDIPASAYYIVFRIYYNKGQTFEITPTQTVEIPSWLTVGGEAIADKFGYVYHVGTGLDFETYTACITALQGDTRKKTVYIHSGTYDIYEETGGSDYWGTFTGNENDWRQYNNVVPPNTTIIGIGDVILNFMPSGTDDELISEDASHVASPVNLSGTCTLENLTINADNCRYALHAETSGIEAYKGSVIRLKNVRVNRYTTYFTTNRYKHNDAFACGFDDDMKLEFENCDFYANTNGTPFRFHDRGTARAIITADNCVIHGGSNNRSMIRLEDVSSSETAHTFVTCSDCFIGGRIHFVKSSGNRNPYDLTLLNCGDPAIDIDDTMTNPYTPKIYNQRIFSDDGTGNITIT